MALITLSRNLIELVLMSAGGIFLFVLITPPLHTLIAAANPPQIWNVIGSWLRPPFLYLIVNGIIISIAASSRLRRRSPIPETQAGFQYYEAVAEPVTFDETTTFGEEGNDEIVPGPVSGVTVPEPPLLRRETVEVVTSFFESQVAPARPSSPRRRSTPTRIVHQDTVEEGQETLDSIWKKITEGRQVPRHLEKSDTGKSNGRQIASSEPSTPSSVKKTAPFNERRRLGNFSPSASTKRIMREPSLSHEDLNRRVEEFIRKQRQQSDS